MTHRQPDVAASIVFVSFFCQGEMYISTSWHVPCSVLCRSCNHRRTITITRSFFGAYDSSADSSAGLLVLALDRKVTRRRNPAHLLLSWLNRTALGMGASALPLVCHFGEGNVTSPARKRKQSREQRGPIQLEFTIYQIHHFSGLTIAARLRSSTP